MLDGEEEERDAMLLIDIRRKAGYSFSGVGRRVDFCGEAVGVVLKEASFSRFRDRRLSAVGM